MKSIFKVFIATICVTVFGFSTMLSTYAETGLENELLTVDNISKIDSSLLGKSDTADVLRVYIWCTDINYDSVASIVEQRLGYGEAEVNSLEEDEIGNIDVAGKVDNYIMVKRQVAKELYQAKLNDIVEDCGIAENVIFKSNYAPMILAELTYTKIEEICSNSDILEIGLDIIEIEETEEDDVHTLYIPQTPNSFRDLVSFDFDEFTKFMNSMDFYRIKEKSSLTGYGVKIGMLEDSVFLNYEYELPMERCHTLGTTGGYDEILHANRVATLLCGVSSIANEAELYSCDYTGKSVVRSYFYQIERLLDVGVKVINMSMGMYHDDIGVNISDVWTNHVILNHNVSIVGAAGNDGSTSLEVAYPLNAENAIAVGACNNMDTIIKSDDIMRAYSSFLDTLGIKKPDIVAPDNIFENDKGNGGTSYSSPIVTGTIALMLECRPSLALHPEVIKAIIMASCQYKALPYEKVDAETMESGLTEKQGAGVFDPILALSITANGNYGYGILSNTNGNDVIDLTHSPYDATNVNVSMSWLNSARNRLKNKDVNLDLAVSINNVEFKSEHTLSSAEMLYTNIYTSRYFDSEMDYSIRCHSDNCVFSASDEQVKYGYAWCHNTEEYKVIEQYEGLYFIKNVATGNYMTYDWENERLLLNEYLGHYHNDYD